MKLDREDIPQEIIAKIKDGYSKLSSMQPKEREEFLSLTKEWANKVRGPEAFANEDAEFERLCQAVGFKAPERCKK